MRFWDLDEVSTAVGMPRRAVWEALLRFPHLVVPEVAATGGLRFSPLMRELLLLVKQGDARGDDDLTISNRLANEIATQSAPAPIASESSPMRDDRSPATGNDEATWLRAAQPLDSDLAHPPGSGATRRPGQHPSEDDLKLHRAAPTAANEPDGTGGHPEAGHRCQSMPVLLSRLAELDLRLTALERWTRADPDR